MRDFIKRKGLSEGKLAIGAVAILVISIGVAAISAPSTDDKQKKKQDHRANLGQAPESDAYNKSYQANLEDKINLRLQEITKSQEKQREAASQQMKASLDRQEMLVQAAIQQMKATQASSTAPSGPGNTPRTSGFPSTKIYSMQDAGSSTSGSIERFTGSPEDIKSAAFQDGPETADRGKSQKTNPDALWIPEGGWVKGRLINGVIGGQSGEFRYTTIKLQGVYYGPNNYTQNLDGCVITGEATPNMSERRFQVKPISLSCTLPNGRNKTWKTSGFIVDAKDGIQGVNATLVNNESKKLAASMAAGALESAGGYYNQTGVSTSLSSLTGSVSGVVTSPGKYVAGGIVQGAGKGLQENVKDYYELFKSTLQVGGGGDVTVHLLTSLELPEGGETISTVRAAK